MARPGHGGGTNASGDPLGSIPASLRDFHRIRYDFGVILGSVFETNAMSAEKNGVSFRWQSTREALLVSVKKWLQFSPCKQDDFSMLWWQSTREALLVSEQNGGCFPHVINVIFQWFGCRVPETH